MRGSDRALVWESCQGGLVPSISGCVTTGSRSGASLVALLPNRNGLSPLDLGSRVLEGFKWGTDVICFIFQKDHVAVEWVAD